MPKYLNMPPTELAKQLESETDPVRRKALLKALEAWRLTQGNPLVLASAKRIAARWGVLGVLLGYGVQTPSDISPASQAIPFQQDMEPGQSELDLQVKIHWVPSLAWPFSVQVAAGPSSGCVGHSESVLQLGAQYWIPASGSIWIQEKPSLHCPSSSQGS